MASSSVSQESLDFDEDFDNLTRRNRIRTHNRGRIVPPHRSGERDNCGGVVGGGDNFLDRDHHHREQKLGGDIGGDGAAVVDHESPTRGAAARLKDKQRNRVNHHKGKPGPKDKRKLREKRRSTGVVHLPSTESTGDSLDEDDEETIAIQETKKNTAFNESTTAQSHHHHHHYHHHHHGHSQRTTEARHVGGSFLPRGSKSPSDLEADLEDNQDYDSAVSQSDSNLTFAGRSESSEAPRMSSLRSLPPHTNTTTSPSPSSLLYSRFSPEASRASSAPRYGVGAQAASSISNYNNNSNDPSPTSSAALTKSSVSALVSQYKFSSTDPDPDPRPTPPAKETAGSTVASRLKAFSGTTAAATPPPPQQAQSKDSWRAERGFVGGGSNVPATMYGSKPSPAPYSSLSNPPPTTTTTARNNMQESELGGESSERGSNSNGSTSSAGGSYYYTSRFNNLQSAGGPPRPFSASATHQASSANAENAALLEKQLNKEKDEKKRLQQQLEQKDKRIVELERIVSMLNRECDDLDVDNVKLQEENKALIMAMQQLSSNMQ